MAGAVELINGWVEQGLVWPVLAGPFVGSFCGVLIGRWPLGRSAGWERSACDGCGHVLGVADLVPLLSFAALRGRCRTCRAPIARFHLWIELACAGVAIWAACIGAAGSQLWASCCLGWTLLTLGWIDAVSLRLPDALTLPLIVGGVLEAAVLEPDALTGRALGAAVGYSLLWAVRLAYSRLRGREGLGLGDAKLLAAACAWVGAENLGTVILIGACGALLWTLRGRHPDPAARIAFGPFLALATWLAWLYC